MFTNRLCRISAIFCVYVAVLCSMAKCRADSPAVETFRQQIEPILAENCYECHGYGSAEGGLTLDEFESGEDALSRRELWWQILKLLRAGIMPPPDQERLPADKLAQLEQWIKTRVFEIDPDDPDPGHVTLRRLNRTEYRNTIRELLGVDYQAELHFPHDDTGHGFDNIGDVLTMSPLHLEKYITAAREIVRQAVPVQPPRPDGAARANPSKRYRRFLPRVVPKGAKLNT
jgi:hypothetical protein